MLDPGPDGRTRRPSIAERAAHRTRLQDRGPERYETLLRHLQAGQELPLAPRRGRRWSLDIHPSAGWLVAGAIAIAAAYLAISLVAGWVRSGDVATWAGPDRSVQSGQRLAACPGVAELPDVYFPSWVRFDGRIYAWSPASWPIAGAAGEAAYPDTGYAHDGLRILRIENTPEGRRGEIILVRQGEAPAGAVYRVVEGCS